MPAPLPLAPATGFRYPTSMVVPETEVIATLAGAVVWRWVVTPGDYLIGRDPGCDLCLDGPGVAGEHARLTVYHLEVFLDDLGSGSSTAVNGRTVQGSTRIWPGQKVSLGEVQFEMRRMKSRADAEEEPRTAVGGGAPAFAARVIAGKEVRSWRGGRAGWDGCHPRGA
jgi:pSer/pThr/pTyr-binding forkhead associated (FHA) protein